MLQANQYQHLIGILSDEAAKFEESLKRFEDQFKKTEYFCAGWVVQHMIQHNVRNKLISLIAPKSQSTFSWPLYSL